MGMRANLENMLAAGRDSALLRLSLGECCLSDGEPEAAAEHLQQAVSLDPTYSAAWKLYARTLSASGDTQRAIAAFTQGISVAEDNGDRQAAKEMRVFLKREKRKDER